MWHTSVNTRWKQNHNFWGMEGLRIIYMSHINAKQIQFLDVNLACHIRAISLFRSNVARLHIFGCIGLKNLNFNVDVNAIYI